MKKVIAVIAAVAMLSVGGAIAAPSASAKGDCEALRTMCEFGVVLVYKLTRVLFP